MAAIQERFEEKWRVKLIIIIDGQLMMNLIMKIHCFFHCYPNDDGNGKAKRKLSHWNCFDYEFDLFIEQNRKEK